MLRDPDRTRFQHMIEAAEEAIAFAENKSFPDLERDRQLQLALVRCVEIIGEAASRVSEDFRFAHRHVPWARIINTRNRLIHAYFDVDLDVIWRTVKWELPELVKDLNEIMKQT